MKVTRSLILPLAIIVLSGCSAADRTWAVLQTTADYYCLQPEERRLLLRRIAERRLAPHRVEVTCGD